MCEPRFRISHAHQPPRFELIEIGFELQNLFALGTVHGAVLQAEVKNQGAGSESWTKQSPERRAGALEHITEVVLVAEAR